MMTSELRIDNEGRIWEHRIKKSGKVSQAGSVVSREAAEQLVADSEARWEAIAEPSPGKPGVYSAAKAGTLRLHYTEDEITEAVRHNSISMSDAMNQDM